MKNSSKIMIGITTAVVAISIAFVLATTMQTGLVLKYGTILLGVAALAFILWKAFVKGTQNDLRQEKKHSRELEDKLAGMERTVSNLERQLYENRSSRFNIAEITPVLHLAVVNIDSSFTRTYKRRSEDGSLAFDGALRAEISADYGIRLEDVRFRFDAASNTLQVAGFRPGFMGFSKKQLTWDIARSVHTHSLLGKEIATVADKAAEEYTAKLCEELRRELEKEMDERQISEYAWLSPLVTKQVSEVIRLMVGTPGMLINIQEGGESDPSFVDFSTLMQQLSAPAGTARISEN